MLLHALRRVSDRGGKADYDQAMDGTPAIFSAEVECCSLLADN